MCLAFGICVDSPAYKIWWSEKKGNKIDKNKIRNRGKQGKNYNAICITQKCFDKCYQDIVKRIFEFQGKCVVFETDFSAEEDKEIL